MGADELRERDQQKAADETERDPARTPTDAVPIGEAIEAWSPIAAAGARLTGEVVDRFWRTSTRP
jgi:hypothetical protein